MTWYDVDDVLYDGSIDEIKKLRCPDCGGKLSYTYSHEVNCFTIKCPSCRYISRQTGGNEPNCVKYFGTSYDWQ